MSENYSKKSRNSEKNESLKNESKEKEKIKSEENESKEKESKEKEIKEKEENEEKSKDKIIITTNLDYDISLNDKEQDSNNDKKYKKKKKKTSKYKDKQVQNGIVFDINNHNIIKKTIEIEIIGDKNMYRKDYEEKIKNLEKKLKLLDEKDKSIDKLSKINLKLQNSLELISKQMDKKILNVKLANNAINKNHNNTIKAKSNLSHEILCKKDYNEKTMLNNIVKEKELNNAVSMIKILRNDNQKLQDKIEEIEKNKEIEKQTKDKKQILIQRELQEHQMCKRKIETFQERLKKLTEKNKSLIDKLIYGKSKKGNYTNLYNNYNESSESEEDNGKKFIKIKKKIIKDNSYSVRNKNKGNLFNLRKFGEIKVNNNNSLPKINLLNNKNLNNDKNSNTIININNIFNVDEMFQLNKVFLKNANIYNIILKKLEILYKSKESIDNKYKLEQKQFTKRILSMQKQIDYLNGKIRENELKLNILQAQLNETKIEKKQLLKRVKILTEGFKFKEYNRTINEKTEKQNKKKEIKKIKFNENKNQEENSIDNFEFKGQKLNNSIEFGNEGDSLSEKNLIEEINNNNKEIKYNKDNDDSEKDSND